MRQKRRGDGTGILFPEIADELNPPPDPSAVTLVEATEEERSNLRGALASALEPEQFQTWFQRSKFLGLEDGDAIIAVPNGFARDWIERYYMESLETCVGAIFGLDEDGERRRVALREMPEALSDTGAGNGAGPAAAAPPSVSASPPPASGTFGLGFGPTSTPRTTFPSQGSPRRNLTRDVAGARDESGAGPFKKSAAHKSTPSSKTLAPPEPTRGANWSPLDEGSDFVLNPKCTFENFVVGPCNRFGHAAALGASEQPGTSYNPLFLFGNVGVGKTHLLQAFCFSVLERFPTSRILYLSCETFVNHFITALEHGDMMAFREKYRNIDVLVVDDIQVLAKKERSQEEFFHTFNSLYNAGKQIVLSSDSPPKEIPTLQDRLVSRFKWGMVTEIEPPCYETRMAIVKRKARERGATELDDDVSQFIAENIQENVRELEGAVTRLFAFASMTSQKVTLELAKEALAGLIEVRRGAPTVEEIIGLVTGHYQVKLSDLQSKRRTQTIALPRQVAMYLARKVTRHSLEEIGGFFGGRDHTTVLYAVEKITKKIESEPEFSKLAQGFMERLVEKA